MAVRHACFHHVQQCFLVILAVLSYVEPGQVKTKNIQVPQDLLNIIVSQRPWLRNQ